MSAMDLFIGLNWKAVKGISKNHFATFSKMEMQLSPFLLCNFRYFYYATNTGSVTEIANSSFSDCKQLENITISDGVLSIEDYAFMSCSALKSVTIPDSVVRIGEQAFFECKSLKSLKLSKNLAKIEPYTFCDCSSIKSIVIPDSVSEIGEDAFRECFALQSVTLGKGLKNIGAGAFVWCSALSKVTIPNGVKTIGSSAFRGCVSLKNITIPSTVTKIDYEAFNDAMLEKVTIKSKKVSIAKDCFTIYNNFDDDKFWASPTAVIYGYKGSTAQTYANKYKIGFQTIGEKQAAKSAITSLSSGKGGYQVQAKFKKVSKAYQYEIQIRTKAGKYNSFDFVCAFSKKNSYKLKKNKNLKKGTTYYIRVRAYAKRNGKQIISPWSAVKKLKMKK